MPEYKAATGHDVALDSLVALDPQPSSPGPTYPRRVHTMGGGVENDGSRYMELVWGPEITCDKAIDVLAALGLVNTNAGGTPIGTNDTADITVYGPLSSLIRTVFTRWNGTAMLPQRGETFEFRRGNDTFGELTVRVRDLEAAS